MGRTTEELNRRLSVDFAYVNVVVGLLCCTGVLGNLSVIAIYRFQIRRKLGNRKLLPTLAAMDLVTCILGTVLLLVQNTHQADFTNSGLCKTLYVFTYSCLLASSFMILFITVQRYLQVCRPLILQYTTNFVRRAPIAVSVLGILLAAPLGVFTGKLRYHQSYYNATGYRCNVIYSEQKSYFVAYFTFLILLFVIGTVSLTILNSFIAKAILQQRKEMRSYRRRDKSSRKGKGVCFSSVMMIEYSDLETKSETIHHSKICAHDRAVGDKLRESCKDILNKYCEQTQYIAKSDQTDPNSHDLFSEIHGKEENKDKEGDIQEDELTSSQVCSKDNEQEIMEKGINGTNETVKAMQDHLWKTESLSNDSCRTSENVEVERLDMNRPVESKDTESHSMLKEDGKNTESERCHPEMETEVGPDTSEDANDINETSDHENSDEIQNSPTIGLNGLGEQKKSITVRVSSESIKSEAAEDCYCLGTVRRRRARITTRDISKGDYDPEGTRYSIMLMVMSVTFVLTWLPVLVVEIMEVTREDLIDTLSPSAFAALRLCESMIIVKNVANPYIFAMFDSEFRTKLLQIMLCVRLRAFLGKHYNFF